MRRRFWLRIARFAARRAGNYAVRRYTTDAEWDAYFTAAAAEFTGPETITSTIGNPGTVTWTSGGPNFRYPR